MAFGLSNRAYMRDTTLILASRFIERFDETWSLCQMDKIRDCMIAFSVTLAMLYENENVRPLVNLIAHLLLNMSVSQPILVLRNRALSYAIRQLYFDIKWSVK